MQQMEEQMLNTSLNPTEEGYVTLGWELVDLLWETIAVKLLMSATALLASLSSLSPDCSYIRSASRGGARCLRLGGGHWLWCVCKHTHARGVWGHAPLDKNFKIRCSEIASETILVLKFIFGLKATKISCPRVLVHHVPCYTAAGHWWSHVEGINARCGHYSRLEPSI